MSVIVMGMEMPETCASCEWSYYVGNGRAMCKRVSMTDKTDIMTKRRADFCPLIEVHTPHGRLIDADVLKQSAHLDGRVKTYIDTWIDSQPTIIEAED